MRVDLQRKGLAAVHAVADMARVDRACRVVRVHRVDPYLRAVLAEGLVWVLAAWYGWVGTPHIPGPVLLHRRDNDSPRVRRPR